MKRGGSASIEKARGISSGPLSPAIASSSKISSPVTKAERRWVLLFAAIVMLATTLPYLRGYSVAGTDWQFTGFVFAVEDGNSYIAKMLSGAAGAWLFRTPYTAHPQGGVLAFLPYLLMGKLSAPPGQHEQLVALYHLFRFMAGVLAILATYTFLAIYIPEIRWRRLALVLATLGGGLGWILVLSGRPDWFGSLPLEFYSPESFGFLSLYGLPHLAMARALLLWGLVAYLDSAPSHSPTIPISISRFLLHTFIGARDKAGMKAGMFWLLLGFFQPLTVVVAWAVLSGHLGVVAIWQGWRMWQGRQAEWGEWQIFTRRAIWAGLFSAPVVIYTISSFSQDSFLVAWSAQNKIFSPHPVHYLLAYGFLLPFAWRGSQRLVHLEPGRGWLLTSWVLLLPFLAYAPYHLQRRLPEGVWVALVILAILGVKDWQIIDGRPGRLRINNFTGLALISIILLPSTLLLLIGGFHVSAKLAPPVFRTAYEVAAFRFLAHQAKVGQVVLAAYETGNALPAWAPVRVVIGHGPESVDLSELRPKVTRFFSASTPEKERLKFISELGIDYVYWGPAERALGDWCPEGQPYLLPVYQQNAYTIYEVTYPITFIRDSRDLENPSE